jgi:exodeoxyribonuclease VII large subunit
MLALPDGESLLALLARDERRLAAAMRQRIETGLARVSRLRAVLVARSPVARVALARTREARARAAMENGIARRIDRARRRLSEAAARLDALSPLAVLGRGYALVRRSADGRIVRSVTDVRLGESLALRLASGGLTAEVTRLDPPDETPGST